MQGKVYQIGYLKRKRVPVLLRDVKDYPDYYYIWYFLDDMHNAFLDNYFISFGPYTLLNLLRHSVKTIFSEQKVETFAKLLLHKFHQKKLVINSGLYFIPVPTINNIFSWKCRDTGKRKHVLYSKYSPTGERFELPCSEWLNPLFISKDTPEKERRFLFQRVELMNENSTLNKTLL